MIVPILTAGEGGIMTSALMISLWLSIGLPDATALDISPLPGTALWNDRGDPAADMVAGISRFLDRELAASVARRADRWHRDLSSTEAYARSIEPNRQRFLKIIGAVGERVAPVEMALVATTETPARLAESDRYTILAVRWGVYPGVEAEGLLI